MEEQQKGRQETGSQSKNRRAQKRRVGKEDRTQKSDWPGKTSRFLDKALRGSWLFYQTEAREFSQHFGGELIALLLHDAEVAGNGILDNLNRGLGLGSVGQHERLVPDGFVLERVQRVGGGLLFGRFGGIGQGSRLSGGGISGSG